jgi:hypothetical protein
MRRTLATVALLAVLMPGCADKAPALDAPEPPMGAVLSLVDPLGDAPEAIDVVGATLTETEDSLIVVMHLAMVPSDFAGYTEMYKGVFWDVCWNARGNVTVGEGLEPGGFQQCAGVWVDLAGPVADFGGHLGLYHEDGCNDWAWCEMSIPFELTAGSPGQMAVTVPRDRMWGAEQNMSLANVEVATFLSSDGSRLTPTGYRYARVSAQGPGVSESQTIPQSLGATARDEGGGRRRLYVPGAAFRHPRPFRVGPVSCRRLGRRRGVGPLGDHA